MFERYTEQARRVVFFARYEASRLGSPYIEPEHLLLGVLRESNILKDRLTPEAIGRIRQELEGDAVVRESTSTSVDIPMSRDLKQALSIAADTASDLWQRNIDVGHLVLGLLQLKGSALKDVLGRNGITYRDFRKIVTGGVQGSVTGEFHFRGARRGGDALREFEPEEFEAESAAPSLRAAIVRLDGLIQRLIHYARTQPEASGYKRLKRKPWSRTEAVGHLLDWATTHHDWFARAMIERSVVAAAYPGEDWVPVQKYQDFGWTEIVELWASLNRLLVHVLIGIPEAKVNTPCTIGLAPPVPLSKLVADYVDHCDDIVGQIMSRL
jgi:hypothetical protein